MRRTIMASMMLAAAWAGLTPAAALAKIRTDTVTYAEGDTVLAGYVAWDDKVKGKRPGVMVVHEWWGLNDYAKVRARQLATLGYVAFAADIYGKGRRGTTRAEARKLAAPLLKDRKLMRRRAAAGLKALKGVEFVDDRKVAAIGYCFGGTCVLELARSGAKFQAAVSFHGGLSTPNPAGAGKILTKILVLHGADDPHVPAKDVLAFQQEMRDAKADWQLNAYGGAVHAFTNPAAGEDPSKGSAYHERATRRAWSAMKRFFQETIGLPNPKASDGGGVVRFTKEKIVRPVGKAGKATGSAIKKAATWTWRKVAGKDEETVEDKKPDDH